MRVCGEMIITNPEVVHHDSSNVTMETGKPGLANVPLHISSVEAQTEKRMDIQAPLTAVYIHTVPALPVQPYIQPPAIAREPSTLHLAMPPLYSKETLPFVTLRLAGGLQPQPRLSLSAVAPTAKPKSAGKHVCPHCGRDCMKPSVLEKHLRCHTGERPYPCTTCGVSFKTQSNLYKHRRTQAHARLSSESEQSSQGSLDSMSSSRETCNSSLSLDEHTEESGSIDKTDTPPASESSTPVSTTKAHCVQTKSSVSEQKEPSLSGHNAETRSDVTKEEEKLKTDTSKQPSTVSRHLPLQRQQATSCSEKWGSSGSRGKSQSHESTDSGFSESSDHYFSPSCVLPDHSLDSLTESSKEHPEESWSTCTSSDKDQSEQGPKQTASKQEQKMLAERISKLISENTAVVEDKQLENVRPRKTVLSKQGSIDLPMPYTYKDSFHFDMRINPSQNTGLKKNSKPILHSAVPTQCTSTQKHNPLTRSNSLPFSITLMQPERNSPAPPNQGDYVTVVRRGSSGQINPTDLVRKPVNQHSSAHHPLVRQTAVDCNHATDSLFINSSVEEACISSLSCDGDVGDICGEPNIRKFRRKKAQKFAYNKWYMYGGGTFKKLYDPDKNVDNITFKGRKCSANSQQDVVQGLQKRVSVVQKEAVSTSTSTISGATGGHNAASHVSSVDLNLHRCLSSTNSSIKAPLRRNLSLSFLPVPTTGPPVGHKTECLNRTEAGRLIDVPKQTDSTWQLCGAHVPSDRKKLRTDDKIGSSIEMETDPNMPIHPPSSVACSVSQHDTNIACVHAQRNPNPNELKGALLLPHILNANVPPVSTSPASSTHVAAKNTFLPKYQLKLPNNCDAESNVSLQVVGKSKETESSSLSDQTLPSGTMCVKAPVSSPSIQTCESSRMKTSTQDQLVLPCIVTSICQGEQSLHTHLSASSLAVVQRQFATTTKTTSCLQDYSGGLCSTLIHPLKPAMAPMPVRLHQPLPPAAVNFSLTTASNQMLASTITAVSHHQPYLSPNLPLAHTQLSTVSDKAQVGLKTPVLSRPTVPLNQSAQNVFHVQTEDLQICFQIISDEQLALIERASGTSLSQMSNAEAATPEVSLSKAQSATLEMSNGGGGHELPENQKQTVGRGSCPSVNTQRKTPPESEAAHNLRERSDTSEVSAISIVSQGLFQQHERRGHVSMVTQRSAGCSISTAASLRGVTSGGIQILENQQAICLNCGAEGQFSLDRRVSQSGMDTLMFSGRFKLSSDSTSTENQKNTNQHKHHEDNHGDLYNTGSLKTSRNVFTDKDSELEGGQCLRDTSREICIKDSVSTDTCKTSRPLTQQTSICCSPQTVSALNTSQNSSRQSHSSSSSLGEPLHDGTSTEHLEMCQGQFTSQSSNIQRERPEDVPAVCTSIQSTTTGLVEGTALMQRAAQKEQQMQECAETPAQPEITDWRPTQSNMEAETNHQVLEEQNLETMSACRLVVPSDLKLQEKETKVDSFKGSCLSEQQLQCSSQTQSGMSEYLPPAPQQTQTTSHNSMVSAVNTHTSLLNSPPLEINQLQPPLKNWDSSIARNQQQVFPEFSSGRHAQVQLLETQIKPELHSSSHQTQTCTGVSAQPAHTSAGNYRTAVSHQDFLISESSRNTSFSSSYRALPSMQFTHVFQESRTTSGLMGKTQTSVNNRNTESLSNPFAYLELDEKQNATSTTPYDQTSPSSNSGRLDTTNKYQSLFLVESFHGYQPAECLTGGVRPVAICQDYTEDTSSSDDEGKLIIELK